MINEALEYIRKEVRNYLSIDDSEIILGHIHEFKDNNTHGLLVSLVNLQEEGTLKNTSHYVQKNHTLQYQQPPVFLNLYLLFAANFQNYGSSLLHLSKTIELFQSKTVFQTSNQDAANPFPSSLEKLIFDFHNLNLEQLNHLWGVLGGAYFPSVLYKVRLVKVQRDVSVTGPEITKIQVGTNIS